MKAKAGHEDWSVRASLTWFVMEACSVERGESQLMYLSCGSCGTCSRSG